MHGYIHRVAEKELEKALKRAPAVAILGPRQCGKSTLAKRVLAGVDSVYLDLQARPDLAKLSEPELFLEQHRHHLVCLDEIQRLPEFFSVLRSEIDSDRRPGRFLILGSASRDLIKQSTESLAGRIAYLDLHPFVLPEVASKSSLQTLWLRGGFPDSLLAEDDSDSADWRRDFTRTFLERDVPALGLSIPIPVMDRLWHLLAHYHGQMVNYSKLAEAVDLSIPTLKKYLALLEQTYMVRQLAPYGANLKKRLVKSTKLYIRDSGILHSLLDIASFDELLSHPVMGASWEGFALETLVSCAPRARPSFLRTSHGAEVDLVLEQGTNLHLFEFKASKAPKPSRGFFELVRDLSPTSATIVAPVHEPYEIRGGVVVSDLGTAAARITSYGGIR